MRGTLRAFGLNLSGRIASGQFEQRAIELVEDRPRLAAMVRPMLIARTALREQCACCTRCCSMQSPATIPADAS